MPSTSIDRRIGHTRITFNEWVRVMPLGEARGILAQAANLSESGIFVSAPQIFTVGTEILCELPLAPAQQSISLMGRVAWVHQQDRGMGIEFMDLSDLDLSVLRQAVQQGKPEDWTRSAKVWFEGMPQPTRARAFATSRGVALISELRFLRLGSRVFISFNGEESHSGLLEDASLHLQPHQSFPSLQLFVSTDPVVPGPETRAPSAAAPGPETRAPSAAAPPRAQEVLDEPHVLVVEPAASLAANSSPAHPAREEEVEVIIETYEDEPVPPDEILELTQVSGSINARQIPSPAVEPEPTVETSSELQTPTPLARLALSRLPHGLPATSGDEDQAPVSRDPELAPVATPLEPRADAEAGEPDQPFPTSAAPDRPTAVEEEPRWSLPLRLTPELLGDPEPERPYPDTTLTPPRRRPRRLWLWLAAGLMSAITVASMVQTDLWTRVEDRLFGRAPAPALSRAPATLSREIAVSPPPARRAPTPPREPAPSPAPSAENTLKILNNEKRSKAVSGDPGAAVGTERRARPTSTPATAVAPLLRRRGGNFELIVPLAGSLTDAEQYLLAAPDGVAINLPRARSLLPLGIYPVAHPLIRRVWVRPRGTGIHLRVLFAGRLPPHQVKLEDQRFRLVLLPSATTDQPTPDQP